MELYNESFRDLAEPYTAPADISIYEQQCALTSAITKHTVLQEESPDFHFKSTLRLSAT